MIVSSYISPKAAKGQASQIQGRGLFAVAQIARDEIVAIKGGHIVDTTTLLSLPDRLRNSEIQIADEFHLVALDQAEYEPVMLFLNHSCEPNVGFAGNVVVVAMRDIGAGEELTTDYALFDDYDGEMPCHCESATCAARSMAMTGSAPICSASTATTSPATSCAESAPLKETYALPAGWRAAIRPEEAMGCAPAPALKSCQSHF